MSFRFVSSQDTQIALDGRHFFYTPSISLLFKISYPLYPLGTPEHEALNTAGLELTALLGKVTLDTSRFHRQLTDAYVPDSDFAAFIVHEDGSVVASALLSDQVKDRDALTFKKVWEIDGFDKLQEHFPEMVKEWMSDTGLQSSCLLHESGTYSCT